MFSGLWKETNFAAKEGAHVHDLHRIRMVSLQDLSPTLASDAAARCQQKYGGSFARGICKDLGKQPAPNSLILSDERTESTKPAAASLRKPPGLDERPLPL